MSKNKGKGIMSALMGRPKRSGSKVSRNYGENEAWEDQMLYKSEDLRILCTKWQDPFILQSWSIGEDFDTFCSTTGLMGFTCHESETYEELSKEFLSTFKFDYQKIKDKRTFDVKFMMIGQHLTMSLEHFCKALHIPNNGSWEEVPTGTDNELKEFWKSVSVDVPEEIRRGRLNHIQHPGLRYFATFLAKGFFARDNSTACT
jgi:hypothetical protein